MKPNWSEAFHTTDFKYGYMYDTRFIDQAGRLAPYSNFCNKIKNDFMNHYGLFEKIQQEKDIAQQLLTVEQLGQQVQGISQHLKQIHNLRIKRREYLYSKFADHFLENINQILYRKFDITTIINGIQADADAIIKLGFELSGKTFEYAYNKTDPIFSKILQSIDAQIERDFPVKK